MDFMKSAEVYDVVENSWKNLPDMLVEAWANTCVAVKNNIFICNLGERLMSYDIVNETYSYVGPQKNWSGWRCIASSKEKLYLFEGNDIFEMN